MILKMMIMAAVVRVASLQNPPHNPKNLQKNLQTITQMTSAKIYLQNLDIDQDSVEDLNNNQKLLKLKLLVYNI